MEVRRAVTRIDIGKQRWQRRLACVCLKPAACLALSLPGRPGLCQRVWMCVRACMRALRKINTTREQWTTRSAVLTHPLTPQRVHAQSRA